MRLSSTTSVLLLASVVLAFMACLGTSEAASGNDTCGSCTGIGDMRGFCKSNNTCVKFNGIKCDGCDASKCFVWQCTLNVVVLMYVIIPLSAIVLLLLLVLAIYCCCCRRSSKSDINVYTYKESRKERRARQQREERQRLRQEENARRRNEIRQKYQLFDNDEV